MSPTASLFAPSTPPAAQPTMQAVLSAAWFRRSAIGSHTTLVQIERSQGSCSRAPHVVQLVFSLDYIEWTCERVVFDTTVCRSSGPDSPPQYRNRETLCLHGRQS